MTGGLIVLFVITLALTLAVPAIISLYSAAGWKDPDIAAQYSSMVALGYYCMPQVFFYGLYVLAGQVLNARDKFGPMMWSPIANNVVSIAVLLIFLGVFGQTEHGCGVHPRPGAAAGAGLDARHRRAGGDPGAVPPVGGLPLRAPVRLPRHRARQDRSAGQVDARLRPGHPGRTGGDQQGGHRGDGRRARAAAWPPTPTRTRCSSCRTR